MSSEQDPVVEAIESVDAKVDTLQEQAEEVEALQEQIDDLGTTLYALFLSYCNTNDLSPDTMYSAAEASDRT